MKGCHPLAPTTPTQDCLPGVVANRSRPTSPVDMVNRGGGGVCVCVCVSVVWCICINNCLASCCTPIRGSIPPGLKGGENFCYADTIDGNCQSTKNLKMWPSVCVSEPLPYAHTSSGHESRSVPLYCFVAITTGNRRTRRQPSKKRCQSSVRCISGKHLNCARSASDSFSMTVSSR